MADLKISELPVATAPAGTELIEIVQGGVNKQTTAQDIANLGGGGGGTSIPYGTTAGTNTITATMSPTVTAYTDGDLYSLKITNTTTGSATLNLDGVGAKKVYDTPEKQISIGDLVAGRNYLFQYNSALDTAAGGFIFVGDLGHERLAYRGGFNASGNVFPATGGSGASGAIRTFDAFRITVAGTLGGVAVENRDFVIAVGDNPTDSINDWYIIPGHVSMASKVDEETFATLTFGSPTNWDTNSRQSPLAKVTATGNFTINMTNVKDGASGVLKIIASTASAFTLTFDTDFTNRDLDTGATLTTWTFPANNGFHYINTFIVDGTTIYWKMGDVLNASDANPWAWVSGGTNSIGNNDTTIEFAFDTESSDNAGIFDIGNPTRLTIPGSGNKVATLNILMNFASNSTGTRRIRLGLNGTLIGNHGMAQANPSTGITTQLVATFMIECVGGDYIEVIPYQNSGGSLDVTCHTKIQIHNR